MKTYLQTRGRRGGEGGQKGRGELCDHRWEGERRDARKRRQPTELWKGPELRWVFEIRLCRQTTPRLPTRSLPS